MNTTDISDVRVWAFEKLLNRPTYPSTYQSQALGGCVPTPSISVVISEAETVAQWVINGPEKPARCRECGK